MKSFIKYKKGIVYGVLFILALFVVLFVNNTSDGLELTSKGFKEFNKGLDLAGGVRLTYRMDLSQQRQMYGDGAEFNQIRNEIEDIVLQNIDSRISQLGVSDYSSYIQTMDEDYYVVVELGGVQDIQVARDIIGKTVKLEFKVRADEPTQEDKNQRKQIAEEMLVRVTNGEESLKEVGSGSQGENIYYNEMQGTLDQLPDIYSGNIEKLNEGETYNKLLSGTYMTQSAQNADEQVDLKGWTITKLNSISTTENEDGESQTVYHIEEIFVQDRITWKPATVKLRNDEISRTLDAAYFRYANVAPGQDGGMAVLVNFNDEGRDIFCKLTQEYRGEQMAIFVGGELKTAPVIQDEICGGTAHITGGFGSQEANDLANELNSGAMPADLTISHDERISPALGNKALQGAIIAGILGFVGIFIYMSFMYGIKKGLVAIMGLSAYLIVLFAIVKLIGYAFSLSAIAAIILNIGMAVDANVLIFERVREGLNSGKSTKMAIIDGYDKSWSAIRDGNVTTGFIGLLLFLVGTNIFRGFGTMLVINILLTIFIVVPLTKFFLLLVYRKEIVN